MTDRQERDLNNMNFAAQSVQLGTMLKKSGASKKISSVELSTATDVSELVADFNNLILKLKESGMMD